VVAVRHKTTDLAMPLWQHAAVCIDAAAVHAFLRKHDPTTVLPIGIAATAVCLAGADALLASVRDAIDCQRAAWQALLVGMFGWTVMNRPLVQRFHETTRITLPHRSGRSRCG
jgi:hypothetical protein